MLQREKNENAMDKCKDDMNILGKMPQHEGTWRNVTGHAEKWRDRIETPPAGENGTTLSEILQTHAKKSRTNIEKS